MGLCIFIWSSLKATFIKFNTLETTFRWISVYIFFQYAFIVLGGVSIIALFNAHIYAQIVAIFVIVSLAILITICLKILKGTMLNSCLRLFCYVTIANAIYLIARCFGLLQLFPNGIIQLLRSLIPFGYLASTLAFLILACFFYVVARDKISDIKNYD